MSFLFPMPSVLSLMLSVIFLVASSFASLMMADLYYLFADICCVCSLVQNLSSLATSSIQVPYKLRTSSVQVLFETCILMGLDCFYLCADILVYVARYGTWQAWLQAPYKLRTSSAQAPYKFCFQTCILVVDESNLCASCSTLPRNSWVLYWVYPSCRKIKLVHELYAVRQL
jgi:hypothetical protein